MKTYDYRKPKAEAQPLIFPPPLEIDHQSLRQRAQGHSLFRPDGRGAAIDGLFQGRTCFLLCSGPSAKALPLGELNRRGVVTMAVNNAWLLHRPQLWVGVDSPSQFAASGWRDPGIMKFVPAAHRKTRLRDHDGADFVQVPETPSDMPNTFLFLRSNGFNPRTFFDEPTISWGTLKNVKDHLGISNLRTVFQAALRLTHLLGFRRVYLLGCDFHMPTDPEASPYSFGQGKHVKGRRSNNLMYEGITRRMTALAPECAARGFQIFNCNPHSHLRVFPFASFESAIAEAAGQCDRAIPHDGWYQ